MYMLVNVWFMIVLLDQGSVFRDMWLLAGLVVLPMTAKQSWFEVHQVSIN